MASIGSSELPALRFRGVLDTEACLVRLERLDGDLEVLLPEGISPELGTFGDVQWLPEVVDLSRNLQSLRDLEGHQARWTIRDLEAMSRRTLALGLGLLAAVLGLTLGFGHLLSRELQKGVGSLVDHLRRVADGDLEPIAVAPGRGELARAERELNRTVRRIRSLLNRLQASETRYRLLAERLPDVVYQLRVGPDGTRSWPFVSPQFEEFYGIGAGVLETDPEYSLEKVLPAAGMSRNKKLPARGDSWKESAVW